MISVFKHKWRVALAAVALGSIGLSETAFAVGTPSATPIVNTATVNYSVASVAQTPINAAATFVVDTVVRLNVTGSGSNKVVRPGEANVFQTYTVTNTGNAASNFGLAIANQGGDQFNIVLPGSGTPGTDGLVIHVDGNGNGTYEPANDTATSITNLAPGSITVFVVGDTPTAAVNGNLAVVRLTADARDPASPGGNDPWSATAGADTAMGVEVVIGNLTANADDTFEVQTAALSVTKSSAVIRDPITIAPALPKAIPLAVVEYTITVSNAVGAQPATLTSISDPVPANTTFTAGEYTGSRDVGVKVGAAAEFFCIAETGGDSNGDGCALNGGAVTVGAPAITTIAANSSIVVRFRVTIQ
jgi:uncharacterized repeat protein (TIGR01451 family)